jgi:hypothetical protein
MEIAMNRSIILLALAGLSWGTAAIYWPADEPGKDLPKRASRTEALPAAGRPEPKSAETAQSTPPPLAAETLPVPPAPAQPAKLEVVYQQGELSVNLDQRSLKSVLAEISKQSGLAFNFMSGAGNEKISMSFSKLPLDQALRTLLGRYDVFYWYGPGENAAGELRAGWIFPGGQGRQVQPVPPEQWASTAEFAQNLMDGNPDVRGTAIEGLVSRQGAAALESVLVALKDADDTVRYRALYKASYAGLQVPTPTLELLAREDASAEVRALALKTLAEQPDLDPRVITEAAQHSLGDTSPPVQEVAQEILGQLNPQTQMRINQ